MSLSFGRSVWMIPLSKIINKFDVRTEIDQDRVIQFAGIYEAKEVELPPVKLIALDEEEHQYAYLDGRHRGAARAYLNLPDVPAVICTKYNDELELYQEALISNWGGAKPPTREDIAHTIIRMMELGATQKTIREYLSFMPRGSLDAYMAWAKGVLYKRRLSRALDAIGSGSTVEAAATQYKLKIENLKDVISGRKGKWGQSRSDEQQTINEMKTYISHVLFSANVGISKRMSRLLKQVEDGEISSEGASKVIKIWKEHLRKTGLRIDDWTNRLDTMVASQERSGGVNASSSQAAQV